MAAPDAVRSAAGRRLGILRCALALPASAAGLPLYWSAGRCEASMALPTALLSDASRRWRGGELDWCFATRSCSEMESSVYHLALHRACSRFGWLLELWSLALDCPVPRSAALPRASAALKFRRIDSSREVLGCLSQSAPSDSATTPNTTTTSPFCRLEPHGRSRFSRRPHSGG